MRTTATKQPTKDSSQQKKKGKSVRSAYNSTLRSPNFSPLSAGMPLLQRQCACGGGCPRCQEELGIQTKLKIGEPGDKYEQEADRIADQVMRMPETSIQRQVELEEEEEEETLQTKPLAEQTMPLVQSQTKPIEEELCIEKSVAQIMPKPIGKRPHLFPSIESSSLNNKSFGVPLPSNLRKEMNQRFGKDFTNVRLHIDHSAAQMATALNAKAFTTGADVYLGSGQFNPYTLEGKTLLAHELVHVLQQSRHKVPEITEPHLFSISRSIVRHHTENSKVPLQRKVIVAGKDWDREKGNEFFKQPYTIKQLRLRGLSSKHREKLRKQIFTPMLTAESSFEFVDENHLVADLLQRYFLIEGLKKSQSTRKGNRCCGYPRPSDRYKWQVNKAAQKYWTQNPKNKTEFELNDLGMKEADTAIDKLFEPQRNKGDRTLLDCLRLIVALRYYSIMKTLGKEEFRRRVSTGQIEVKITKAWKSFLNKTKSGGIVVRTQIESIKDLIPGDHVYFSNHISYRSLVKELERIRAEEPKRCPAKHNDCQDIWQGEHAVFLSIDTNGKRVFQGHGTRELTEEEMVDNLLKYYNCHLEEAMKCEPKIENITLQGGTGNPCSGKIKPKKFTLKKLTQEDIPGLRCPEDLSKARYVRRPIRL